MNAPTITMEQVRTALERIRFAPVDPNERGAAYYFVGGIDALLTLMPDEPEEVAPPCIDKRTTRQKYADDAEALAAEIMSGKLSVAQAMTNVLTDHTDSPPAADPPLTIPPLPAGPGAAASAAREAPAAEAAAPPMAPAPAPPPVLAAEGNSSSPNDAAGASDDAQPPRRSRSDSIFPHLTEEQKAAFRLLWPNRTHSGRAIRERLNKMGGASVNNDARLYKIAKQLNLPARTLLWAEQDALAREAPGPVSLCADEAPPAPAPEVIEPAAPTFAAPENPAETSGTPAPTPALRPAWRRPEPPLPGPTEKVASIKFDPKSLDPLDNGLDEPRNVTTARGLLGDGYGVEYVARMTRLPASSVRAIVAEMEKAGTA